MAADPRVHASDSDAPTAAVTPQSASTSEDVSRVGTQLGRFALIEEVGAGGMGRVYRARDEALDRIVAVKTLRTADVDAATRARMLREAQAMAQLNHPAVVPIYDVQSDRGTLFIAMEFVEGRTVEQWLRDESPSWRDVVATFVAAGRGLAAAHAVGLVHRDFKPANILIGEDGRVRVTDFGLARATGDTTEATDASAPSVDSIDGQLTTTGMVVGTPAYMAPEQHSGGPIDERADVYAFCASLWRGLFGTPPFGSQRGRELVTAKRRGPPELPAAAAHLPLRVRRTLRRGLAGDPASRWRSTEELLAVLSPARRGQWLLAGGLGVALLVTGMAVLGYVPTGPADRCNAEATAIVDDHRSTAHEIENAFLATGHPRAAKIWADADRRLAEYATQLAAAQRDACTGAPGHADGQCLVARRRALRAATTSLRDVDRQAVSHARGVVGRVPRIADCVDAGGEGAVPHPTDPDLAARVELVRAEIATVDARVDLGQFTRATADGQAALLTARATDYPPVVAEAGLSLGIAALRGADNELARSSFEDAYFTAQQADTRVVAARAAAYLVYLHAHEHGELAKAEEWLRHSAAALEGDDTPSALALYENMAGTLAKRKGELDDAMRHFSRSREIWFESRGPDDPQVGALSLNLGGCERDRGNLSEALEHHQRALAIFEHAYGPDHPDVGLAHNNMGTALQALGRLEEAVAHLRAALELRTMTYGPDNVEVATTELNLAGVLGMIEDEGAVDLLERAVATLEKVDPEHLALPYALNNLGVQYENGERYDDAERTLARSLALFERALGDESPQGANVLTALAKLHRTTGDLDRAAKEADRARTILEGLGSGDPRNLVKIHEVLASVAWQRGDHDIARAELDGAERIATDRLDADDPLLQRVRAQKLQWAASD